MFIFQTGHVTLIHIPIKSFRHFLGPVLQLLLYWDDRLKSGGDCLDPDSHEKESSFINISVTPIECSIVCPRQLAVELFESALSNLDTPNKEQVIITEEDYVVVQVEGEGLNAGQRVVDLTTPLALAGIPIFFVTTYFSDYILVPLQSQGRVVQVLTERGFKFETAPDGRSQSQEHRATSLLSTLRSYEDNKTADQTKSELQSSTFAKLRRHNIAATANRKIKLVLCAGVSDKRPRSGSGSPFPCEPKYILQLGLVRLLTSQPQFVSVTFTANEPASILLEKDHLACFAVPEVLLGAKEDILVPIMLDLTQLPIESTGIVCGVAGRLVRGTVHNRAPPVDMIYLSTTCAGTVIVPENELGGALSALNEEALDAQYTDMF